MYLNCLPEDDRCSMHGSFRYDLHPYHETLNKLLKFQKYKCVFMCKKQSVVIPDDASDVSDK